MIDEDYRGELFARLRLQSTAINAPLQWEAGDRLLQVLIVPVLRVIPQVVTELDTTDRGLAGLGSTGR